MVVGPEVIDKLTKLGQELAEGGRTDDAAALTEAVAALARLGDGWLTTGQAADRLNVVKQTIKNWLQRGTLRGVNTGTRWLVSRESVETIEGIRRTIAEAEDETYPSPEEIYRLTKRTRQAAKRRADVA